MEYVDIKSELDWLESRKYINCNGGYSTYDGLEAAAWIMSERWSHPEQEAIHAKYPYFEFPSGFGPVVLDGINLNL